MKWIPGACLAFLLGVPAAAEEAPRAVVPVRRTMLADPAIRAGSLPNGLRYRVMRSTLPAGGISLRLGIDVGSFEEQESERGFAHVVEHMAFRATRSAPDGGLERRFAPFGIAFGRDQNAETSLFATTYRLDFASAQEAGLAQGLGWLRDVADGVLFPAAGVATERGVVLSETQARHSAQAMTSEAVGRFQAPGMRSITRLPGGTPEALAAATGDTLRAFYERWYRPGNAVLVVVGDQPVEALEAKVRAAFSSWQGKGPAPKRAAYGALDATRGLDAFAFTAPSLPTIVSACRVRAPDPRDDEIARTTRDVRSAIWQAILAERFKSLVNAGNSGMLGAAMVGSDAREFAMTCLLVVPAGDAWEKGLAVGQAELRRFAKDGPTERELEQEIEESRAVLRGAVSVADARTAPDLATQILTRTLDRRPVPAPIEAMHAFDVAVEDLDPAAVKASFAADWSGTGPLLSLVTQKPAEARTVRDAWVRNEGAAALAAFADRKSVAWAYTDFGKAGTVVDRQAIADPGFVRLRFANGVILNFKQSALEKNGIELRAHFGAGRRELPDDGYMAAMLGTSLLATGGLGRMSGEDVEASLRDQGWKFTFQLGNDAFQLVSSTTRDNLALELQVFAAFLSDPGFRPALDERIAPAVDIMYRMYRSEPTLVLSEALTQAIDPGGPLGLPPQPAMAAMRSADFARLLKPALTTDPIELTLVGDVDEATAIELVSDTIGALPARTPHDRARADAHFIRFAERDFPVIRAQHQGPADRAATSLVWPLYTAEPSRRPEEYALKLVAGVFDEELRQRIRIELGKSYAPQVQTVMPDYADQGYLIAAIEGNPADIATLIAEAKGVAARISAGGVTAEMLEAARRPLLSQVAAARGGNAWWAGTLGGSARNPAVITEHVDFEKILSAVTLAEVNAAAAKWLARVPIVTIATPAAAAKGAAR